MNYSIATNEQLKIILEKDAGLPPHLIGGILDEVVKRDIYNPYMIWMLNKRFKAIRYAEHVLQMEMKEIKNMLYYAAYEALKHYKAGKNTFFSFWIRFMITAIERQKRHYEQQKRTAELVYMDEEVIQLKDDTNTERKAINLVFIEYLLNQLEPMNRTILLLRNQDYTYKEIGHELGLHRETVRQKYLHSIKQLRGVSNGEKSSIAT